MGKIIGTNAVSTFTNAVDLSVANSMFISGSQSVWSDVHVSGSDCIQCFVVPCIVATNPTNTGTTTGGLQTSTSSIWWDTGLKVSDAPTIKLEFLPLSGSIFNDVNSSQKRTGIAYGVITCLTASTTDLGNSDLESVWASHQLAYTTTNSPGSGYGTAHHKLTYRLNDQPGDTWAGSNSGGPLLRSSVNYVINPMSASSASPTNRAGPAYLMQRVEGSYNLGAHAIFNLELGSNEDRVYIFASTKRMSLTSAGGGALDDFRLRFKLRASIVKIPKVTIPGQT